MTRSLSVVVRNEVAQIIQRGDASKTRHRIIRQNQLQRLVSGKMSEDMPSAGSFGSAIIARDPRHPPL